MQTIREWFMTSFRLRQSYSPWYAQIIGVIMGYICTVAQPSSWLARHDKWWEVLGWAVSVGVIVLAVTPFLLIFNLEPDNGRWR
ncbi:hypothetical protein VPHK469_0183 [Vibrio phage K469]